MSISIDKPDMIRKHTLSRRGTDKMSLNGEDAFSPRVRGNRVWSIRALSK